MAKRDATLSDMHDLVIVGAGPSGSVAALRGRQLGASVLLLDRAEFPRPRTCAGWISPAGVAFAQQCGMKPNRCGAVEFNGLTLHTWDLKKHATIDDSELGCWAVDRAAFDQALVKLAVEAGAHWFAALQPERITLRDDRIELSMADGRTATARMLLVADGCESATARLAGIVAAGGLPVVPECTFFETTLDKPASALDVFLMPGRGAGLASLVRCGKQARLTIFSRETGAAAAQSTQALLTALRQNGLVPAGANLSPTRHKLPLGSALELETHIGKRSLLIGNAGGFVAAFSGEGVYPAMQSGWVAAECAVRAAQAKLPQDELASFAQAWRCAFGDYLRPPNTDLAMLLPLVFSNGQMSKRVARAFLLGQPF
ncbi:MAG: NAD(P)/FAD-dependent oxidoreductase [Phycisphaerae bacterium]